MKPHVKIILALLLVFTALTQIHAQQKFEFMTINYELRLKNYELSVSIDGKEFSKENIDVDIKGFSYGNTNPLLAKISEYQDKGWEVVSFSTMSSTDYSYLYTAFLRKKKD